MQESAIIFHSIDRMLRHVHVAQSFVEKVRGILDVGEWKLAQFCILTHQTLTRVLGCTLQQKLDSLEKMLTSIEKTNLDLETYFIQ